MSLRLRGLYADSQLEVAGTSSNQDQPAQTVKFLDYDHTDNLYSDGGSCSRKIILTGIIIPELGMYVRMHFAVVIVIC